MPQTDTTSDKLYQLLAEIAGIPTSKVTPDMAIFGRGLGLDSLSGTTLMAGLDKVFGVKLDDIDLHMDALDSVGALADFLQRWSLQQNSSSPAAKWSALLTDVAVASQLKEGRGGIERILAGIWANPGITSRDLATACALPTPTVAAVRKEMVKAGLLKESGHGAQVTELGERIAKGLALDLVPTEHGAGAYGRLKHHQLFPALVEQLTALLSERPTADTSLDQAKALPETVAARALLALEYGMVAGRRVALVGDDDFTSIGLAVLGSLLHKQGAIGPEQITVLDIDDRILSTVADLAARYGYPISTRKHDMRTLVPTDLAGTHDAIFTDPPYTAPGATLFLSRGVELCRHGCCVVFFSFASKGPSEMLEVQRFLLQMGLLIREVLPGFNRYEGASLWGNQSQMLVCEGVGHVQPVHGEYTGPLYTADFRKPR